MLHSSGYGFGQSDWRHAPMEKPLIQSRNIAGWDKLTFADGTDVAYSEAGVSTKAADHLARESRPI
ncbi:hypothetical protein [Dyella sp. S184]|uniref:hypothetical protein n=1 Tax=Dyella sp. S184 TaxID=1641862 RepID=UPI00131D6560|nr:hypothetical protein [Dyella sp. S184]